jgi:hypothetical protein
VLLGSPKIPHTPWLLGAYPFMAFVSGLAHPTKSDVTGITAPTGPPTQLTFTLAVTVHLVSTAFCRTVASFTSLWPGGHFPPPLSMSVVIEGVPEGPTACSPHMHYLDWTIRPVAILV